MGDASGDAERRKLKSPVRWGILGCGDVTEKKSGPAFQKARGSELVAVMRRSPGLARDYARRHGVGRWYEDADALISDPDVDAVYVATPPGSHAELALRCARARKPCYVEKPMARSTAECRSR
jgi:1,5-anhydro-D-fructose reductase (1,5-anhydro-D-mannitol-forming)